MPRKKRGNNFNHTKRGKYHKDFGGGGRGACRGQHRSDGYLSSSSSASEDLLPVVNDSSSESGFSAALSPVVPSASASPSHSPSPSPTTPESDHLSQGSASFSGESFFFAFEDESQDCDNESVLIQKNVLIKETCDLLKAILPSHWICIFDNGGFHILLLSRGADKAIQRNIFVSFHGAVRITVYRKVLKPEVLQEILKNNEENVVLSKSSQNLYCDKILTLVHKVRSYEICAGVDDDELDNFIENDSSCFLDANTFDEQRYTKTIRSHECDLILPIYSWKCTACFNLGKRLKRKKRTAAEETSKFKNNCCLTKEEALNKLGTQAKINKNERSKNAKLQQKVRDALERNSIPVQEDLSEALANILRDSNLTPLQQLFIQQQYKASQAKGARGMRWHPTMIRLALALKSSSTGCYRDLIDSGAVRLPGLRTLYDYEHALPHEEGVHYEKFEEIRKQIESYNENYKTFHKLFMDEMHISQKLVTNKHSGEIIGYVKLSEVEEEMKLLTAKMNGDVHNDEPELARKMLVYMIKGIATNLKKVVGSFTTGNLSKGQLFERTWEVISACEKTGVKILAVVCDGAAENGAFFDMHQPATKHPGGIVFDSVNLAAPNRNIYFISDVPHLLKTIRNNFAKSGFGPRCKKLLTKNGQTIIWKTIEDLYLTDCKNTFRRCPKLNNQCVYLNSYTCMKVSYAAAVLSNTVAQDLKLRKWRNMEETYTFIKKVNDFFDDLNGAHTDMAKRKQNRRLEAYTSTEDERFTELLDFEKYLDEWEAQVHALPRFSQAEKAKMYLSHQTVTGIKITIHAFIGAVSYMLGKEGAKFINARAFCQDSLKQYFSRQRSSCGGSRNPNAYEFGNADGKIDRHRNFNVRKRSGNTEASNQHMEITTEPLPKKRK
ncbi:Transposable element P transposase [Frankliniella fusca]|uniref:Transposable element P transposase n=1 Tax=Frankliniella fusca TaxID=407009 RepID=A0AAE1GVD6_9NEOP|nr:Transposable element P transposase [Frankliniella fusca]